jgi:hypothetical protein
MQYLMMIYEDEAKRWGEKGKVLDPAERDAYQAFGKEFAAAIKGGGALQPASTATTVRVVNGKRLTTDGPFAETKEQLGGYYLVEAADLDEALAMAAKLPGARFGCVEVRPLLKFS